MLDLQHIKGYLSGMLQAFSRYSTPQLSFNKSIYGLPNFKGHPSPIGTHTYIFFTLDGARSYNWSPLCYNSGEVK